MKRLFGSGEGELSIKPLKDSGKLLLVRKEGPEKWRALALLLVDIEEFREAFADFLIIELAKAEGVTA